MNRYHWALFVGPKDEVEGGQGTRYHSKERLVAGAQMRWVFDRFDGRGDYDMTKAATYDLIDQKETTP